MVPTSVPGMTLERPPIGKGVVSMGRKRGMAKRDRLTRHGTNTGEGEASGNCTGVDAGIRCDLILDPSMETDASDSYFPAIREKMKTWNTTDQSSHTPEGAS